MSTAVTNYFAFSYDGLSNFGESRTLKDVLSIDFPLEQPAGYGMAISNGFFDPPAHLGEFKKVNLKIASSEHLILTVEFKTVDSRGAAEREVKVEINDGDNEFEVIYPTLISELIELVLFVKRADNEELEAELKIDEIIFE